MLSCFCVQVSTVAMTQPQGQFGYQIVRIIKTSSLGVGSYGAVYRALCDELPCAAKVIHPTLFETHDPGARKIMERFEQECQFLSGVRHPHIVQYLGVSRDPESGLSGLPVLLMELMDSSLTRFLEQSEEPLPFHIQVGLCHDVALALSYLHSNGIIHRDLSSNNVLLIGPGNRAKVTDFGMSKIADANPRMTPMTMCPGTLAYMPPEALDDSPVYTKKLDSFSFGVLDIQIITRHFPDPSQRFKTMEINDPRFPTGRVKVPVPEIDRRQSHIDLIGLAHPLLPVALDCLKDMDKERPSAQELCHRLAAVKETPQYSESVQQATSKDKERQISELQREKAELIEQRTQHVQQHEQHAQQIRDLQQQVQTQSDCLQARVSELTQQIGSLQFQLQEKNHEMEEKDREMEQRVQELNAQIRSNTAEFQQNLQRREETIQAVRQDNQIEQVQVSETQTTEESNSVIGNIQQPQQTHTATHQPTETQAYYLSMIDRVGLFQLQWRDGGRAPFKGEPGSVAADGNIAYFNTGSGNFKDIIGYDNGTWSTLPKCGRWSFDMAVISGLLTVIGGVKSGKHGVVHCDSLLSLTGKGQDRKWVEHFPPMQTKRTKPAVVCNGKFLVVAGGRGDDYGTLNTVEVMDTETLQWSTASSLPGDNSRIRNHMWRPDLCAMWHKWSVDTRNRYMFPN